MAALVSVLIPAHNAAALLPATLESLRAQQETNWEAIIVDDGSTDGTSAVAAAYARTDARICLVRRDRGGTQAARNAGLLRARGRWIALLDHDDLWHPEKLAVQLALARAYPQANLLFTNYTDWDGTHDRRVRYLRRRHVPDGDVSRALARGCLFQASTVMMPRRLAEELGGFDPSLHFCGDWDLWLRLARRGIEARGTWRPLVRYRIWSGNESRQVCAMQTEVVRMLGGAIAQPQSARLRQACVAGLRHARAKLELIGLAADETPTVPVAERLWRSWSHEPHVLRHLWRCFACALPAPLGGACARAHVLAHLRRKWRLA